MMNLEFGHPWNINELGHSVNIYDEFKIWTPLEHT